MESDVRLPRHFYIDIGNLCNLRCPFCVTGAKLNTQPTGFMKLQSYKIILDKLKESASLICLYNWGEPLMNPDLIPMIQATAQAGIRCHIDTNLTVRDFSDEEADAIIASGLTSLFASIDGASQEAYSKYRVRGQYNRAVTNLTKLVQAKDRSQSHLPFLGWQYHVHRYNEGDMQAARERSDEWGVPIVFKRLSTPDPDWKSSFHDNDLMFISGSAWVRQIYAPPHNPELRWVDFHPQVLTPCRQMFETMVVEWNGDVYPCTVVSSPQHVMGNLLTHTLQEVWNGPEFQRSRTFIKSFGPRQNGPSVCENQSCAMTKKCAS